jgi:hypothetical protein
MKIRFIVSAGIDYSKMICMDVGPKYAQSLGLEWSDAAALPDLQDTALIIDTADNQDELEKIRRFIRERTSTPVLLKISDPYWVSANRPRRFGGRDRRSPYTRFLEESCTLANVGILSMYEPNEWLKSVVERFKPKLLVLPYPYLPELEIPLTAQDFAQRHARAILTGSMSRRKYPARTAIRWRRRVFASYRRRFDILEHPGYPNTGATLRHSFLFDGFVKYLASYQYMFLCASRADLEFLKFGECAYAGCVPIGAPAGSLPAAAKAQFLDPAAFIRSFEAAAPSRNSEHFARACAYRESIRSARRAEDLREQLAAFIRRNF